MARGHFILCLNSGSSSLKFALYEMGAKEEALLAAGAVERIGLQGGHLWIHGGAKESLADKHSDVPEYKAAVQVTFAALEELSLPQPSSVGHRIVHGGSDHVAPERVDRRLIARVGPVCASAPSQ